MIAKTTLCAEIHVQCNYKYTYDWIQYCSIIGNSQCSDRNILCTVSVHKVCVVQVARPKAPQKISLEKKS